MKNISLALGLAAALLAGCGGGGSSSPYAGTPTQPAPSVQPSVTPSGTVLSTMSLNGAPAFVTSGQLPVYTFGGDTVANQSSCTAAGGCLGVWPPVAPPAGTLPTPWAAFTRADNGQMQLSYNGAALYTFVSDSPGVARGDGVENFHLSRPLAAGSPTGPGTPGYP